MAETDLTGAINEEYVFFGGHRIARIDRPSGNVHYYFSDHLGSASVITDPSARVQESYFYYPYGGILYATGSDPNHYKFTGKERDNESGNDNFGARYYTSNMGRFMTPDWAARPTAVPYAVFGDPQTLNLFTYVENGPINRADADGHQHGEVCIPMQPGTGSQAGSQIGEVNCRSTGESQAQKPAQNQSQQQTQQTQKDQQDQKKGTAPSSNNDSSKKSDPSTVTVVAAGAGLAPQASGAANAATDAARNFMKSTKPDPPLRGAPGETPRPETPSPERQLMKDAIDEIMGLVGGAASGGMEFLFPFSAPTPQQLREATNPEI